MNTHTLASSHRERIFRRASRESPLHYRDTPRAHSRRHLIRIANHLKQRPFLLHAIHGPRRVENLMPAVLAVRLRKHIQLHIGRVALQLRKLRTRYSISSAASESPSSRSASQSPRHHDPAHQCAPAASPHARANNPFNSSSPRKNTLSVMRSCSAAASTAHRSRHSTALSRALNSRNSHQAPCCAECPSPCSTTATASPRAAQSKPQPRLPHSPARVSTPAARTAASSIHRIISTTCSTNRYRRDHAAHTGIERLRSRAHNRSASNAVSAAGPGSMRTAAHARVWAERFLVDMAGDIFSLFGSVVALLFQRGKILFADVTRHIVPSKTDVSKCVSPGAASVIAAFRSSRS
jgi:hypothetical protein